MAIRVDTTSDVRWILVTVDQDDRSRPIGPMTVAIERKALDLIEAEEPAPTATALLDLIARRAARRLPVANGPDGLRLITTYNLSVVWPK